MKTGDTIFMSAMFTRRAHEMLILDNRSTCDNTSREIDVAVLARKFIVANKVAAIVAVDVIAFRVDGRESDFFYLEKFSQT